MNSYQLLSTIALKLKSNEDELLDLERRNWIGSVAKNGQVFLSEQDAFKARFILHLRRLKLTDEEIGQVLDTQAPPYSLARIPEILGRPIPRL